MKDKKQHDKDRVFGFLKKYITLSLVSILLVISIIFFSVYHNLEISRVTGSSISSLQQLSLSCDSLFDSIRKLNFQIFNDGDINNLVNDRNPDTITTLRSYGRLSSYSSTGTNIISIYVYSSLTDCFFSTILSAQKQSRISFFDKEAVGFTDNIKNIKVLYPIPRKIKLYGAPDVPNNTANVYTFIYYGMPNIATGYFNRAIMINVSEEWVRKSLEVWNKGMKGNICIMNEEGKLVSSLFRDEMLKDITQEEFASKILKSKKETGDFVCDVSGAKSFVTFVYSSKPGWFFIRIIPYSSIYDNIKKIGLVTVVLLLLYIAVGFILAYIITGKAKKSIDDIIDSLEKEIQDNRTDLDKLKDEYLFNSLNNNIFTSNDQMIKDFKKYKIVLSGDKILFLILFRIDHYYELCTSFRSYDIKLLKQAIMKIASEIFHVKYAVEAVDMKDDCIILAFNDNSYPEHTIISQIDDMIKLVQESSEKNIKISLSAVLSPSAYTFNDINLLYTEVKQASNYRMFYGHKCIIHSEKLKTLKSEDYVFPTEKEKILMETLMLGKVESAGKLLDEILDSTRSYPFAVLNSLLLRLMSSISSTFESIENISKYSIDYDFNSFMEVLNKCETIDEMRNEFYGMFRHVFSILEQKKNSKYGVLINKAIHIINQEYTDENLCLNTMAVKLGISPGYLGKLFRTYTSKSVADYINQTRVDSALKLLEESDLSINEVADRIGFSSNNYFYPLFKKVTGMTPAEYRQIQANKRY